MQLLTPLSLTPLLMPQLSMLLPHTNLPLLTSLPPYVEPEGKDEPYTYQYGVADDYSK